MVSTRTVRLNDDAKRAKRGDPESPEFLTFVKTENLMNGTLQVHHTSIGSHSLLDRTPKSIKIHPAYASQQELVRAFMCPQETRQG